MAKLNGWLEIFKTGKHPGEGELADRTWTTDDLDQIVANFDSTTPVPHIITHERMYSPFAYAQGVELKRDGDSLYVRSENINPDFAELLKNGSLYARSVGINKTSDGFTLDHIAWLGAEPPAVQGLEAVTMAAADQISTFSYVDTSTPRNLRRLLSGVREFLIEKFDIGTADRVLPADDVERAHEAVTRADNALEEQWQKDNKIRGGGFSQQPDTSTVQHESPTGDDNDMTPEELEAAKKQAADEARAEAEAKFKKEREQLTGDLNAERDARRRDEWTADIEAAQAEGTLTPAQAEGAVDFAMTLDDTQKVTFSRGGKSEEMTPAAWFKQHLASMGKKVPMADGTGGTGDEATGDGVDITDANAVADAAVTYQREQADKGITISVSQAVEHVTAQQEK